MDKMDKVYLDMYLKNEEPKEVNSKIAADLINRLKKSYIITAIGLVILICNSISFFTILLLFADDMSRIKLLLFFIITFIFFIIGLIISLVSVFCDNVIKNELACVNIHFANVWNSQLNQITIDALSTAAKTFSSKHTRREIDTGLSIYHKVSAFGRRKEIVYGTNMELVKADVKINRLNGRNAINSYIGILVTFFLTIAILVLTFLISKVPGISIPWYVFLIIIVLGSIAVVIASVIDFIYIIKFINTSVNQIRNKLKEEN